MKHAISLVAGMVLLVASAASAAESSKPFVIKVADEETGRGVPLVELETVGGLRFVTDSGGIVAFYEPGLMDQRVFFKVRSHGYEFAKDGFGFIGQALDVTAGGNAVLKIKRLNVAERLYRVTGGGIYAESVLAGLPVPIRAPVLNAQVLGSDSVVNAVYGGKLFWFWGDTNRPSYPLGNFHVPGAVSDLPRTGGLDPETGVNLTYFLDKQGFAKPTCEMPGEGPTWIGGLVVLNDQGKERMFAAYVKVRGALQVYEHGLVEWNSHKNQFEKVTVFPKKAPAYPNGHPFLFKDNGTEYVYFPQPLHLVRVKATPDHLKDLSKYEAFTCMQPGTTAADGKMDRGTDGVLRWSWRAGAAPLDQRDQSRLSREGKLKPGEALIALRDMDSGKSVWAHGGSIYWNPYRRRWITIFVESGGSTSMLGEVWHAEADRPTGPWIYARKVATHDRYSFYNPKQHPMFDKENGRIIFFEGTYTETFSGNSNRTPRYEYNQIMYKLHLASPRLALPVPVHIASESTRPARFTLQTAGHDAAASCAFFALDRPGVGTIPIFESGERDTVVLRPGGSGDKPVFHALPANMSKPPRAVLPLYEFRNGSQRVYTTEKLWSAAGFERAETPVCLVWPKP